MTKRGTNHRRKLTHTVIDFMLLMLLLATLFTIGCTDDEANATDAGPGTSGY